MKEVNAPRQGLAEVLLEAELCLWEKMRTGKWRALGALGGNTPHDLCSDFFPVKTMMIQPLTKEK